MSPDESRAWGDFGETPSALESSRESCWCSNVANGPTAAELIELVDAAIVALDGGGTEIARAHLRALAEAVRTPHHGCRRGGV